MRLLPLMLWLSLPVFAMQPEPVDCSPNLTDVDMCEHALKISNDINKTLPSKSGKLLTTSSTAAHGPVVVFHIDLSLNEEELTKAAASRNTTVDAMRETWSATIAQSIEETGCSQEMYVAFVYMGGVYKYQYFYSDGALFTEIEQRECPEK